MKISARLAAIGAWIAASIATVGESPLFVTAMAHAWFAYAVLATCVHFGLSLLVATPVALLLVAGKEFWFDLRYETTPKQTVWDSTQDAIEYAAGIALAVIVYH